MEPRTPKACHFHLLPRVSFWPTHSGHLSLPPSPEVTQINPCSLEQTEVPTLVSLVPTHGPLHLSYVKDTLEILEMPSACVHNPERGKKEAGTDRLGCVLEYVVILRMSGNGTHT